MKTGFKKVSQIAMITTVIIAIYSIFIPKTDSLANEDIGEDFYSDDTIAMELVLADTTDFIEVIFADKVDTLIHEEVIPVVKAKPKKKKKVYKKKIKDVSFAEVTGGNSFSELDSFFKKIDYLSKNKSKVRIAYFGDSITESDLCSSTFRANLQDSLGGVGVGFVPAVSGLSKFRRSIYHTYSDNWTEYSIRHRKDRNMPLGIFGNVAIPSLSKSDSTGIIASSVSSNSFKIRNKKPLANPKLIILNKKAECEIKYILNKQDTLFKTIEVDDEIQIISLTDSVLKSLDISYYPQDTTYVYGCDFSQQSGIYVDNYSIRGNKGNNFVYLQHDILEQFFDYLDYDLLVLHYGANVTDPIMRDYSWYRISMKKNIKFLKTMIDETPIIMFSMGDRGAMVDSTWVSSPDIPFLIKEQQRIAKDTKSAFWNILTALGGEKTNVKMHDEGYLIDDHTHFTRKGASYFGKLTFDKFMQEYSKYLDKKSD